MANGKPNATAVPFVIRNSFVIPVSSFVIAPPKEPEPKMIVARMFVVWEGDTQ